MDKLQPVDKKSRTLKLDLTGEAEISTGPKMEMGLEVFGGAMKAEVSAQVGVKVAAKLNHTVGQISEEDAIHACALCLDGEAKWFVTADAGLSIKFMEFESKLNATLFNAEGWIDFGERHYEAGHPGSFFISIINDADSVYGGHLTFGGGECQNKKVKTTFEVEDAQGAKIESALSIKKVGSKSIISANSPLTAYLYKGTYIAKASVLDVSVSKTFSVDEDAQVITLTAHSADGTLTGTVIDAITNNPLPDASIVVWQREQEVAAAQTNSAGAFSIAIPAGDISIRISKDGYTAYTCYETVQDGETRNIPVIRLVPGNGKGGFSGQITDAATGNPVEGVTLRLRAGWNNSEVGDIIRTLTTDSNGRFEYNMVTLGGLIIHGLDAGNYTLTASKAGYETSSFNVIVYPGVVTPNQDATIAVDSENLPDSWTFVNAFYDETQRLYVLTPDYTTWTAGAMWYSHPCDGNFTLEADYYTGSTNRSLGGGDGMAVAFYADKESVPTTAGELGFSGCKGYGIELDTWSNTQIGDPDYNHIALVKDTTHNHLKIEPLPESKDEAWHHLKIVVNNTVCSTYIDNNLKFSHKVSPTGYRWLGIMAGTGDGINLHAVKNVVVRVFST